MKRLEEVFKTSGIPTYTFVPPVEYPGLLVALRTPGRGVVIEGPSGIGKTTAVTRALEELGLADKVTRLSARRRDDLDVIHELPSMKSFGTVLIDDFHRLPTAARGEIADLMKLLADRNTPTLMNLRGQRWRLGRRRRQPVVPKPAPDRGYARAGGDAASRGSIGAQRRAAILPLPKGIRNPAVIH